MEVFFLSPEPVLSAVSETVASMEWGRGEGRSLVQTVAHEVASPASHYSRRPGNHEGGRNGSAWLVVDGEGWEVHNTLVVSRFGDVLMTIAGS